MNNQGIYNLQNGGKYSGQMVNGLPHGEGYAMYPDGTRYEGHWSEGRMNGHGKYFFSDGSGYEGIWFDGELIHKKNTFTGTGHGHNNEHGSPDSYIFPNGGVYNGNITNGLPHGKGTCKWKDGSVYEGNWVDGKMHGVGVMRHSDGSEIRGLWYDDNLILVYNKNENQPQNGSRLALVIGNCDYPSSPLRNCINDAEEFARKLRTMGFDTMTLYNATKRDIDFNVDEFCRKAPRYDAILFFFSGHGCQNEGKSYLVPTDYAHSSFCFMDEIVAKMDQATPRIKIAIIDACRSNLERSLPSNKSLFDTNARNTFLAYATASGFTASDGRGDHSPYMEAILEALTKPRLELGAFFREVVRIVRKKPGVTQIPWIETCTEEDFFFNRG